MVLNTQTYGFWTDLGYYGLNRKISPPSFERYLADKNIPNCECVTNQNVESPESPKSFKSDYLVPGMILRYCYVLLLY
jgi:hypothetical protein